MDARLIAERIGVQTGYKSISWQEAQEDLLAAITIRNVVMYTIVGAILLVASFGTYNIISTITHEKTRDIAILKSLGFRDRTIRSIFIIEAVLIGLVGAILGWIFGYLLTRGLASLEFSNPFSDSNHLPVLYSTKHYLLATGVALLSSSDSGLFSGSRGGAAPSRGYHQGRDMSAALIEARGVTKILGGAVPVTLVQDINLSIMAREFIAITGPSGSGKSSLLYLLGLLDLPTVGDVLIDGRSTTVMAEDERAEVRLSRIGFVFQFHFLLPEFSITENVALPMRARGLLSFRATTARAEELLASLGLGDHRHKMPDQLSGGQRQRVAVARALANDPPVILADEPTGSLDTMATSQVFGILRDLVTVHKKTVVAVTHDLELASQMHRRINVVDGRLTKTIGTALSPSIESR